MTAQAAGKKIGATDVRVMKGQPSNHDVGFYGPTGMNFWRTDAICAGIRLKTVAISNPTRTRTFPRVESPGCACRDDEATLTVKDVADACGLPQPVIAQLVPRQWVDGAGWMYTRQDLDFAVEIGGELRKQAWDHVMTSSPAIPTSNAQLQRVSELDMARFVLSSVDYDQMGGGVFPAVEELQRQLPVTATLMRQIPGPDRADYFVGRLDQPIKYHPVDGFDWGRSLPQFVAEDEAGRFVWVYAIIVASLMAGTQLHAGMKGFPIRVAYVIDHTLGRDAKLDFAKCDYISYGIISDPDEPAPPPPPGTRQ